MLFICWHFCHFFFGMEGRKKRRILRNYGMSKCFLCIFSDSSEIIKLCSMKADISQWNWRIEVNWRIWKRSIASRKYKEHCNTSVWSVLFVRFGCLVIRYKDSRTCQLGNTWSIEKQKTIQCEWWNQLVYLDFWGRNGNGSKFKYS